MFSESATPPLAGDWLALKDSVKRFEHAWREGPRPRIDDYLPTADGLRGRLLIELVHIELELRLKAGEPARVEEYLSRYPELADNRVTALELIAAEGELRGRCEPTLGLDDYLQRFPQFRADLREQFARTVIDGRDRPRGPVDQRTEALPEITGFEVVALLGRGGMGVVYQARQLGLNRTVALKMVSTGFHAGLKELARFRAESATLARLQHPNIVQIYDVGEAGGRPYFVFEFVAGGSLAQQLQGAPQPVRPAAQLVETVARAVHAAHANGVIHRDLKPANILLKDEVEEARGASGECTPLASRLTSVVPKITDFGLAKCVGGGGEAPHPQGATVTGELLGTPGYMAPEQAMVPPAGWPARGCLRPRCRSL